MPKPTFTQWNAALGTQSRARVPGCSGRLGRWARWIQDDACWPECRNVDAALRHLRQSHSNHVPEVAVRMLFDGWRSFRLSGCPLPQDERPARKHRGYWIPDETEKQIMELRDFKRRATGRKVTLGDVIAEHIALAHRRLIRG